MWYILTNSFLSEMYHIQSTVMQIQNTVKCFIWQKKNREVKITAEFSCREIFMQ